MRALREWIPGAEPLSVLVVPGAEPSMDALEFSNYEFSR